MNNVTNPNHWIGTGVLASAYSGGPVRILTRTRLRQGTGVVFDGSATPRSGMQQQA